MAVNIIGVSKEWLISDKAQGRVYQQSIEFLTATEPPQNTKIRLHTPLSLEWLISDQPQARLYQQSMEVLTVTAKPAEPQRLYRMYKEVLYRLTDLSLYLVNMEALMVLDRVPSIFAQYTQDLLAVTQSRSMPPMATVISMEYAGKAVSMVIQKASDMPFVWSLTRVTQATMQVVQSRPNSVISVERAAQAHNLITSRSAMPVPLDMVSPEQAGQNVLLICQSLDIPYQPTSGLYAPQQTVMAVQASTGLMMWRSPAMTAQYMVRVVQKRTPEPFPKSLITVGEQVSQVVQGIHMEVPLGLQWAAQSASQVVQATTMPDVYSPEDAAQAVMLTTQQTVMEPAIGLIQAAQERLAVVQKADVVPPVSTETVAQGVNLVVQARPEALPLSKECVTQGINQVTQGANYDVPGNMLARTRVAELVSLVLQPTAYDPVNMPSKTDVPQARIAFTVRADPAWYPPLKTLYDRSRFVFAPQFVELVPQSNITALPWSQTCVAQYSIITATHTNEPSPAQMARSGVFLQQAIAQTGYEATYFSTDFPISNADVYHVNQQYAMVATYPDAFLPTNYAVTFQIDEQIALKVIYDAPESLHSPVKAAQVSEQLALTTGYADPETLHTPVKAFLVTEQLSVKATYPAKDVPQSRDRVAQLTQQTAITAKYPDKSTPQATERVMQVRNSIVTRDTSMYQLPVRPRRHRVRITVRLVY